MKDDNFVHKLSFIRFFFRALTALMMFAIPLLTSCGGSEDDENNDTTGNVYIRFSLGSNNTRGVQNEAIVRTYKMDNTFQLNVSEADGFAEAITRGMPVETASKMSDFSTYCFDESGGVYYENIASGNNGQLKVQKIWPRGKSLRFYAIHPSDAAAANFSVSATNFSYTYTVSTNVEKQPDLMYASTGIVAYNSDGLARIHMRHALAAITIKVGTMNNVSKINSITLRNVRSKGRLSLPVTDEAATWTIDNGSEVKDYSLTSLNFTTLTPGTVVNQNERTFLMLPQNIDNVVYEIDVTMKDGTTRTLSQSLAGENPWAAGKTRTYEINML